MFTPPSQPVTGLRAAFFGDSGGSTSRYYWVQPIYATGRGPLSGAILVTTPAALSTKNAVLLVWNPAPGAIGYNVYKTATSTAPSAGSIAVFLNLDTNSCTDTGQSDSLTAAAVRVDGLAGVGVAYARYSFAVDAGAQGAIVPSAPYNTVIPANAILIGGTVDVLAAVTSGGAATVAIGTTAGSSATSILAATGKASLTLNALLNAVPVFATPVKMSAAGSINFTVGTADLTAGIIEVMVLFLQPSA